VDASIVAANRLRADFGWVESGSPSSRLASSALISFGLRLVDLHFQLAVRAEIKALFRNLSLAEQRLWAQGLLSEFYSRTSSESSFSTTQPQTSNKIAAR
jgi:hypothetical protein